MKLPECVIHLSSPLCSHSGSKCVCMHTVPPQLYTVFTSATAFSSHILSSGVFVGCRIPNPTGKEINSRQLCPGTIKLQYEPKKNPRSFTFCVSALQCGCPLHISGVFTHKNWVIRLIGAYRCFMQEEILRKVSKQQYLHLLHSEIVP